MKKRVAVIGAGVSGLTSANILRSKGMLPVIFEQNSNPGGLIRSSKEEGNVFHRVGGVVFNTKEPRVNDWFWSHFDIRNEFILSPRNAKINLNGRITDYPVESHLYHLPGLVFMKIFTEFLSLAFHEKQACNFDEFLRQNFGKTLYKIYFRPYNAKIWNFDLRYIPLPWLDGKLPMPDLREILMNNLFRRPDRIMVHRSFYYPLKGGSSFIAHRLAEGLKIVYHTPVERIEKSENGWIINGDRFGAIIYTGDVRRLGEILVNLPDQVLNSAAKVKDLPSNGTSNVLCYTDDTDLSWLYLPDSQLRCHRIVYTGNLSPFNNSRERKTCLVEFGGKVDQNTVNEQIKLLPGNLEPIAYHYEPCSYVIQLHDTRDRIAALKQQLEFLDFYLVGRFAEWEYYNMDMAMLSAMKICDRF